MLLVSAPFACGVFATVPSEEPVVDLWQLFQEAELEDPRVLAGRARSEGGAWREREAFGQLLPQLSASSTLNRTAQENDITRQTYNDERYALTLSQVIYDAQTGHNYRCYSELARQQEAEYAITQEEVTLDLIERYFTALAAEDELALVSAELRATERNLARHKSWRVVAARRRRLACGAPPGRLYLAVDPVCCAYAPRRRRRAISWAERFLTCSAVFAGACGRRVFPVVPKRLRSARFVGRSGSG
jgi:hypothetical protein